MIKGLYIHIPFCDQICTYCDFCKMVTSEHTKKAYLKALIKELEYYGDLLEHIETIYIGGGTPSSLDDDLLDAFLDALEGLIDLKTMKEITIEANPNDVSASWLEILRKHHINRVSMGVQSMHEDLLKFLGRTHTKDIVLHAIELLKTAQFNFNLDFLYGIPGQSQDMLMEDLDFIKDFNPQHISYYSLILEDRTVLNYLIKKHKVDDFPDDLARTFGEIIDQRLKSYGYHKYEFSNYAKAGYESKHNLIYWNLEEYLGVGLNASSQFNYVRMVNPSKISEYLEGIKDKSLTMHRLEDFNPQLETLLVGLRKTQGISLEAYQSRFKKDVFDIYPQLKKYLEQGLLETKDGYLRFTNDGIYLSNQVFVDII